MSNQVVKVSRIGRDARSTDPNDFIFHSDYNTFKIIKVLSPSLTVTASSTVTGNIAHNLGYIPLVTAYAKRSGVAQVFLPNGVDVELYGAKLGAVGDLTFNYVSADNTNVNVNFTNVKGTDIDVDLKIYCLERIG